MGGDSPRDSRESAVSASERPPIGLPDGMTAAPQLTDYLDRVGLPCRFVAADGRVLWRSRALDDLISVLPRVVGCCESLGFHHVEGSCLSHRTIASGRSQRQTKWLGRFYVQMEAVPVDGLFGDGTVSFESFRDVTVEKRLEAALTHEHELLETINKAMIEINQNLETAHSELEQKNRSLEEANAQLRSLDQMKDEFISIVSHELKVPLTSIKGSVEMIRTCEKDKLSATGLELLAICQRSTDRLHRLVRDLLDIARIESGRLSLSFSRFPVAVTIDECLHSVSSLAEEKRLELRNDVPADLILEADRERFVQVILNLVTNAIKFTDGGVVSVTGSSRQAEVTVSVSDTGVGITAEAQAKIFDKFTQVGTTLHRNAEGTGLGLAIVRGIVREHGGDVSVDSRPGVGSCFAIQIPQPPGKGQHGPVGPLD